MGTQLWLSGEVVLLLHSHKLAKASRKGLLQCLEMYESIHVHSYHDKEWENMCFFIDQDCRFLLLFLAVEVGPSSSLIFRDRSPGTPPRPHTSAHHSLGCYPFSCAAGALCLTSSLLTGSSLPGTAVRLFTAYEFRTEPLWNTHRLYNSAVCDMACVVSGLFLWAFSHA